MYFAVEKESKSTQYHSSFIENKKCTRKSEAKWEQDKAKAKERHEEALFFRLSKVADNNMITGRKVGGLA